MVKSNVASVGFPGSEPRVFTFTIPRFDSPQYAEYLHLGARYSKIVPKSSALRIAHAGWLMYTLIHPSSSQINIYQVMHHLVNLLNHLAFDEHSILI